MPMPVGGMTEISKKIIYPQIAKRAGIEGKVYVLAFIDENGNVANARVIKGIDGGCDEAALDAVKQTKFNPGKQDGKPVKVQVTIPIVFKLQ
jgi:protein TonB